MLKTLRRIIQEVNAAPDLASAMHIAVTRVSEVQQTDTCSIFLVDEERGEYVLSATKGLSADIVGKARLKLGEGLVGLVGEREEPINVSNAPAHPAFITYPYIEEEQYRAFMGVPIVYQGELLGVLVVQQQEERTFAEDDVAFLMTLSTQLSPAIAAARAKGSLRELEQKRRGRRKSRTVLMGIPGAPGVAIGEAIVVYPPADLNAVPDQVAADIPHEVALFEAALSAAREEIHDIQIRAKTTLSIAENALFEAYSRMLDSRTFINEVIQVIEQGQWAQGALKRVINQHVLQFESLEDAYLQERASDFRDLGRRILAHLQTGKRIVPVYPKNTILVSDEVTATALMEVPDGHLAGVLSGTGSSNSHVAILARALGLPTVMGVTGTPITQLAGQELIVDGYNGEVYIAPPAALKKQFQSLMQEEQELEEELDEIHQLPAETSDGHKMALYVNTGLATDGGLSLSAGAEGVGLYRTEMPFMLRDRFPSEEEQYIMYRQLLSTFSPRPVIMRTLDIGGDKALPYFPVEEANPFLGWRGVRITLDHPEIFLQQIRAMLRANLEFNNLSLMLPMITSVNEVEESIRLIHQAYHELQEEGFAVKMPALGLMVEVPAAVYQSYELAKRVDFLSVGSNDLIQYLLAVDRNNPRVANLYNGLHPAVLRALQQVVKAGHRANKKVSICGEMASDPIAVILLLAMGFDTLSMSARSLPRMKWVIRKFSLKYAKELLKEVLVMDDPVEVRCHMEMALEKLGLGGLIRAGKT